MQITADISVSVGNARTMKTSGLGLRSMPLSAWGSIQPSGGINRMTHKGDVFQPIEANRRIYQKLYSDVYQKMYENLSPLYRSIRKITGYPR